MNKSRLNANLKAKSTRSRWEARWESVPVGPDSKEQEREQRSMAMEKKKHDKGKRLDIQRRNQKNGKPDKGRLCRFGGIRYSLFSN